MIHPRFLFALHVVLVIYMITFPFLESKNSTCLWQHALILCFIMLHWLTNLDTCALTEMEYWARRRYDPDSAPKQRDQTFFGSIVSPVYNVQNTDAYKLTILLTLWTVHKALRARSS